jgi:hypothetical protein
VKVLPVVTASYRDGILTISVGLKTEQKASAKKIKVTTGTQGPRRSPMAACPPRHYQRKDPASSGIPARGEDPRVPSFGALCHAVLDFGIGRGEEHALVAVPPAP